MKALVLGIAVMAVAVLAVLPFGLGWGEEVLAFLRGVLPVLAAVVGLVLVFVGIADIRDRAEEGKEDIRKENR